MEYIIWTSICGCRGDTGCVCDFVVSFKQGVFEITTKRLKKKKKLLEANIKSPLTVQLLNPSLKVLSYHLLPTDTKCQSFRGGNDPPQNFQRRSDGHLTASRNTYDAFGLSKANFVPL